MTQPLPGLPQHTKPTVIRAERCEKCKFSAPGQSKQHVECRRYPPALAQFPVDVRTGQFLERAVWPKVAPTEFCGEWKPKVEGVN